MSDQLALFLLPKQPVFRILRWNSVSVGLSNYVNNSEMGHLCVGFSVFFFGFKSDGNQKPRSK